MAMSCIRWLYNIMISRLFYKISRSIKFRWTWKSQLFQINFVIFISRIKLAIRRTIKSWKIFFAAKLNDANRIVCCNSSERTFVAFLMKSLSNESTGSGENFGFSNDLDSISKFGPPNKSCDFNWTAFIADKIGCEINKWDLEYW